MADWEGLLQGVVGGIGSGVALRNHIQMGQLRQMQMEAARRELADQAQLKQAFASVPDTETRVVSAMSEEPAPYNPQSDVPFTPAGMVTETTETRKLLPSEYYMNVASVMRNKGLNEWAMKAEDRAITLREKEIEAAKKRRQLMIGEKIRQVGTGGFTEKIDQMSGVPGLGEIVLESIANEGKADTLLNYIKADKGTKPINMPNWYDAIGAIHYPDYATNPTSQSAWNQRYSQMMQTPEGRKQILRLAQEVAQSNTPTAITYLQTNQGFVPAATKGPRVGTVGQPTGDYKPMPNEMVTAEQQILTLKETFDRAKALYKPDWVGPVAGRTAGVLEKTVGIDPQRSQFNSQLAQLNNTLIYLMSGKQINEQEYVRLKRQLPDPNLPPKNFEARMNEFERTFNSIITNRQKNMGGYGVGAVPKQRPPLSSFER